MGRGRVELRRIDNTINRQVTFAKRRNGLLKKAYELSVLCDAEVAFVIFSSRGRLYEYSSGPSMMKTLERYQKCNYGAPEVVVQTREFQSSQQEYLKLKAKVEALQRSQRNLLGEDLGQLSIKDLEHLERQMDTSLRQIRSQRTQYMLDQLTDLQKKEQMLCEANKALRRRGGAGYPALALGAADYSTLQLDTAGNPVNPTEPAMRVLTLQMRDVQLEESSYARQQEVWEAHAQAVELRLQQQQQQEVAANGFFHPLQIEPTLQIEYQPADTITAVSAPGQGAGTSYVHTQWLA